MFLGHRICGVSQFAPAEALPPAGLTASIQWHNEAARTKPSHLGFTSASTASTVNMTRNETMLDMLTCTLRFNDQVDRSDRLPQQTF